MTDEQGLMGLHSSFWPSRNFYGGCNDFLALKLSAKYSRLLYLKIDVQAFVVTLWADGAQGGGGCVWGGIYQHFQQVAFTTF